MTVMVRDLGNRRKDDGRRLVASLEQAGVQVYAAFWVFRESVGEWRLQIVTPDVQRIGPRAILRAISDKIENANGRASFDLFDIEIDGLQNPALLHLIETIGIYDDIYEHSFKNIVIGNTRLEAIDFYFMKTSRILQNERLMT
jgi:hypothetical protein